MHRGIRLLVLALCLGACFEPVGPSQSDGSGQPYDGGPADGSWAECTSDAECHAAHGDDWFCSGRYCIQGEPDASRPHSGADAGPAARDAGSYSYSGCVSSGCAYETLACAARAVAARYSECTAASDCVLEFWQGGCVPVCQEPINKVHADEYRAALGTEVYSYCACATNPPSVTCGPANPPLDCIAGRCARARPVDGGLPDATVEPPDAAVEPADAGAPDACTPETDSQLCGALGLTCGPGRGIDLCGVVRDVDCGPCGTLPLCGPGVAQPCERICSWLGYCWVYPQPMGGGVSGIDGVAANDVWIVGSFGATLHWDGTSLKRIDSGTGAGLNAVKAFSANEVWATGEVAGWTDDIKGPATIRWNGATWASPGGTLGPTGLSLWGSGAHDIWLDRYDHWDGATWTSTAPPSPNFDSFAAMWGTSSADIWYWPAQDRIFHFDGTKWTGLPLPVWGWGWVNAAGIAGTSSSDVWAGSRERFMHWNGSMWSLEASPSSQGMTGAFSRGQDVWTLFGTEVLHRIATGWDRTHTLPPGEYAERMWTDGTDFWFGKPSLLHWDGADFQSFGEPPGPTIANAWGSAVDLWSVSENDAKVGHWNGSSWAVFDLSALAKALYAVGGTGTNDVWAVGSGGAILHWDGKGWSLSPSGTTANLRQIIATAADDAWAAGDSNVLLRWDGLAWHLIPNPIPSPALNRILSLWGSAANDVWAASGIASLSHYDGKGWTTISPPCPSDTSLTSVWGTGPNDVWASGLTRSSEQVAMHWDGLRWTKFDSHFTVACGSSSRSFLNAYGHIREWNGATLQHTGQEWLFWNSNPKACAIDDSGDLWLFLQDGSVLQRSGRWR